MIGNGCTTWLSRLATLLLTRVGLLKSDLELILSTSLNLESLRLDRCSLGGDLCVQHPSLKKLSLLGDCQQVEVNCPHLEIFKYHGRASFRFSHVPLLREATLNLSFEVGGCSSVFAELARNAPQLQALSLWVTTEVLPLPPSTCMPCLKRLNILADVPTGFNLLTIMHMLYASPALEALNLKLKPRTLTKKLPQMEYPDRPLFQLKEVEIEGLSFRIAVKGFVKYLLRNGVALQKMVFVVGAKFSASLNKLPEFAKLQDLNPSVQVSAI